MFSIGVGFVAGSLLLAAGCASTSAVRPVPAPSAAELDLPPLRFVDAAYGREHSRKAEELVVPFGVKQNGTELLLVAVQEAEDQGAAFLGDLELIMTFKWNGTPVACSSRVVFADDPLVRERSSVPTPAADPNLYTTEIDEYQPRRIALHVDEEELFCKTGHRMIARDVSVGFHRFDASERILMDRRGSGTTVEREMVAETVDSCEKRRVRRDTVRYDYEVKLGFVPPDWAYLSKRLAGDRQLVQTPPSCYRIEEAELTTAPAYRLVAKAYHQGSLRRMAVPASSPAMTDLDVMDRETDEQRQQRCKDAGVKSRYGGPCGSTKFNRSPPRGMPRWDGGR